MWPFKKKEETKELEVDEPKEYSEFTVTMTDDEVIEFKSWNISRSNQFLNFQTHDGWIEIRHDGIKKIKCKHILESNVVSLHKEI